jgi:hypothetical protein
MAPDERPSSSFKDSMAAILDRLWELARSEELDAPFRRFKAKVAPIEFVYIGARAPLSPLTTPTSIFINLHLHRRIALRNASRLHARGAVPRRVRPPTRHPQGPRRRTLQRARRGRLLAHHRCDREQRAGHRREHVVGGKTDVKWEAQVSRPSLEPYAAVIAKRQEESQIKGRTPLYDRLGLSTCCFCCCCCCCCFCYCVYHTAITPIL